MSDRALAALFVLGLWWLSTGVVLKLVWLARSTYRWSVSSLSALALLALYGLAASSRYASVGAAYLAFGCALTVWGWHELTFLLGLITGPRKAPCPPGAAGWRRFGYATATLIYHEIALALTLAAAVALTRGGPNQVGTQTFFVLWIMRLSAKFNVFLGVRNLTERFVPEHLRYLLSYFRRARLNPLMPASLACGGAAAALLAGAALAPDATPAVAVGRTLVATILGLAVLEHIFLTLPLPDAVLWHWAIQTKTTPGRKALRDVRTGAG